MADFVALAKANSKDANFGSPAAGATPLFVGTMPGSASGVNLNHIPFKGGAPQGIGVRLDFACSANDSLVVLQREDDLVWATDIGQCQLG